MRWRIPLAVVLAAFVAVSCNDATVFQPDEDATFSSASAPLMVLSWQETFDQQYAGEVGVTPSGIMHMEGIDNGFVATGDLEGYVHFYGRAMIDTRTGIGNGSGSAHYDLTKPGVGTLECQWHSKLYDFPDPFVQYAQISCKGTGYFEGWKVKMTGNNENNPGLGIYDVTGEFR